MHPLFLKKPERVEALVFLMVIALQAYLVLQRQYRQQVSEDGQRPNTTSPPARCSASSAPTRAAGRKETGVGRRVQPTPLTPRQREILQRLGFPTPRKNALPGACPARPPSFANIMLVGPACSTCQGAKNKTSRVGFLKVTVTNASG